MVQKKQKRSLRTITRETRRLHFNKHQIALKDLLVKLREFKGLNSKECAKQLGVENSQLSAWENGRKQITLNTLTLYALTFNIPISWFFLEIEKKSTEHHFDVIGAQTGKEFVFVSNLKTHYKLLDVYGRCAIIQKVNDYTLSAVETHYISDLEKKCIFVY